MKDRCSLNMRLQNNRGELVYTGMHARIYLWNGKIVKGTLLGTYLTPIIFKHVIDYMGVLL